jgi:hypothetical protein
MLQEVESMRECENWTSTLPSELPLWELDSRWTPEFSKNDCKGQNPLDWGFPYIIGNLLERKCLKWAHMTHLGIWNSNCGQKKSWESNWQFDSRPLKVENHPLVCRWHATYLWKFVDESYNFVLDLILIRGVHKKLCAPEIVRVPTLGISGLPLGSPETKWHLGAGLLAKHKVYYKGEGGGFPQVRAVVSLVSMCCPWLVRAPKCYNYALTNLRLGFVQVRVNSWCLWFFLVPSWSSSMPFYPRSATSQGSHPNSFSFHCLHLWTRSWV